MKMKSKTFLQESLEYISNHGVLAISPKSKRMIHRGTLVVTKASNELKGYSNIDFYILLDSGKLKRRACRVVLNPDAYEVSKKTVNTSYAIYTDSHIVIDRSNPLKHIITSFNEVAANSLCPCEAVLVICFDNGKAWVSTKEA